MSSFSPEALTAKLNSLNNTAQSIQTVSLWLIHHRKHAKIIVKVWFSHLMKAKPSKKLIHIYLANDVVQNSKKKGPEFNREFSGIIVAAYKHVYSNLPDEKTLISMQRVLKVWSDRSVFKRDIIQKLKATVFAFKRSVPSFNDLTVDMLSKANQNAGRHSRGGRGIREAESRALRRRRSWRRRNDEKDEESEEPTVKKPKIEEMEKILQPEPTLNPEDIPEPEDVSQALRDLENSASSDATVREKIARLPPEVQDVSLLEKIKELDDRGNLAKMLKNFTIHQDQELKKAEEKLKEYDQKFKKVTTVRKELESHIQKLPDLTLLPDVTGGLAPLPSAGDLFSLEL
ncbi:putative regulation of nuclear pre-mRNA domain-containing protein 1B [Apostichopus japonicus]|uniref:Putative regulation of nuclear pre-mRNA domain-containing protein 1B n=1 Tax=Stichopus japonicus TaxID=307972 RepID=A0A2G8KIE5_STIJA|nr:putative regulation of nuclear pre-mRNA domain-containing protein 1B [Apostichopus japonicus]